MSPNHRPLRPPRRCAWLALAIALVTSDANAIFVVNQPWVRPAAKGQSTEVYMDITSSDAAALVAVHSEAAARAVILAPGIPRRNIDRLPLPLGKMVRLAPGVYRIALDRLAQPVALGARVALTLTIEAPDGARQEIPVSAEARKRSPFDDERRAHSHMEPH